MSDRHARDAIYSQWMQRPEERRSESDAIDFAQETYDQGQRLASHSATHYQHVMDLLRGARAFAKSG